MATPLGVHADRLAAVRALRSVKGRRGQRRFAFEGATLLHEAHRSNFPIEEIFATQAAFDGAPLVRELDATGIPTFIVEEASAARISDLRTPTGIVSVGRVRLRSLEDALARDGGLALVLADVNDPANAGTLMRSADAFGCAGVVLGDQGVDPYHPKVVRGSMGAIFRLTVAVTDPPALQAGAGSIRLVGLAADGASLTDEPWERPLAVIVGNERHGLGRWEGLCDRIVAIPMEGQAESLSAAVAGSIALYAASRRVA